MKNKVAIIATKFLEPYINEVLKTLPQPEEFKVYLYTSFDDLAPIYESLSGFIKGIVTSGSFPCRVLDMTFPKSTCIIKPFNNDNVCIYKLFLDLLNNNRNLELKRVYVDVLDIAGIKPEDYEKYMSGSYETSLSDIQHERISKMSLDELLSSEEHFANKHIEMWKNKKIDVSVTRFSSIMERLKQAGLNVRFAYPDVFYIKSILLSVLQEVTINELDETLTCSIFVTVKPDKDENIAGKMLKRLRHSLNSFSVFMNLNYHIQKKQYGFEIFTNKESARSITENFTTCKLNGFLTENLNFETYIGYGIGFSLYHARINAVDANSESSGLSYSASCMINERDQLISPLHPEKKLVVFRNHSEVVKQLSKSSGLSCLTIQKIIAAKDTLSTGCITSETLSNKLSITKRSANRFLNSLKKSGFAHVVEEVQNTSKGRPTYVYKMNLNL